MRFYDIHLPPSLNLMDYDSVTDDNISGIKRENVKKELRKLYWDEKPILEIDYSFFEIHSSSVSFSLFCVLND